MQIFVSASFIRQKRCNQIDKTRNAKNEQKEENEAKLEFLL
jgi:hypothetical protein